MPAIWPAELPQRFQLSGNSETLGENRIESQTDKGPPKRRPRSSAVPGSFTGTMRMSLAQWDALLEFGETTLGKWCLPFSIPRPGEDGDWLACFKTKPSRSGIGGDRWNVSFTLEILP